MGKIGEQWPLLLTTFTALQCDRPTLREGKAADTT